MLENNANKNKNKQRLGRGLGSLFADEETEPGMVQQATSDAPPAPAPTKDEAPAPVGMAEPKAPEKAQTEPAGAVSVPTAARIWTVSIDKVIPNKGQPRKEFDAEKIKELANSIKEQGVLQPIVVRKLESGQYEIIAGERRWRATQAAGLHEIPVIIKEADNKQVMEWALIENIQRENLNPLEEAEAYNQLISDYAYTHQALADKMGKDRATVSNSLRLLTLTREVRELLKEQKISAGHAKVLLGLENSEQQKVLAKDIVSRGLSVRALEKEVQRLKKGKGPEDVIESSVASRMAESLAAEMQKELGTKVVVDYKDGKGKVLISFYSDGDLTMIAERIKGLL